MPSYAVEQRKKKARGTDEEDEQLMGEAHRIFSTFSTFQNEKSKKGTKKVMALNKGQFMTLIKKMAQEKRIRFVSEAKIDQFIEREFPLHDVNQTGFLTLDEFVPLYRKYLTSNPDDVMSQLASTTDALEKLFLMFDKDKDMGLRKSEVIELCKHKTPPGLPEPAAEKLTAIVDDIYTKFDKDVSGDLDYDEFVEAYNDMVDQLGELHKEMRRVHQQPHSPKRALARARSLIRATLMAGASRKLGLRRDDPRRRRRPRGARGGRRRAVRR